MLFDLGNRQQYIIYLMGTIINFDVLVRIQPIVNTYCGEIVRRDCIDSFRFYINNKKIYNF